MTTSIIFKVSEINKVDFFQVNQNIDNLQYSIDKTRTYVSWNTLEKPSFVSSMTTIEGYFTQSQLFQKIERPDWLIII